VRRVSTVLAADSDHVSSHTAMNVKETMIMQATDQAHRGMLVALVGVLALLGAFALSIAMPAKASAAVEWKAVVSSAPTNLPPGGRGTFTVRVSNSGDTTSPTWPTVTVALPEGVTFDRHDDLGGFGWACSAAGDPEVVTCDNPFSELFPPTEAYTHVGAWSGFDPLYLKFTVEIAAAAIEGAHPVPITFSGGGAVDSVEQVERVFIGTEQLGFGTIPGSFEARTVNASGQDDTQAGAHPYKSVTGFAVTTRFQEPPPHPEQWFNTDLPTDFLKDVVLDLPAGFAGDPTATPQCLSVELAADLDCPVATQVGTIRYGQRNAPATEVTSLHNMVPEKGTPAQFAFGTAAGPVLLTPVLRSDGDWGLRVNTNNISEAGLVFYIAAEVWGVPADPSHDGQRCPMLNGVSETCVGYDAMGNRPSPPFTPDDFSPHSIAAPREAFLSNPTRCDGAPVTSLLHLAAWQNPARFEPDGDPDLTDPAWATSTAEAPPLTGCEKLAFDPSIDVEPTNPKPGSPSGLQFKLTIPQSDNPDGLATAHLKDAKVILPQGVTVNSGSADGQGACSSQQIGLVSKSPVRFTKLEPACPLSSKIGEVEVVTPVLDESLTGDVYLAAQADNPFDSLLAMYIVIKGPGILGKLAAHVQADPTTGQLTTTVTNNPQLPFETLTLTLKSGDRAPLTVPAACGSYTVGANLSSWAGQNVDALDSFDVPCPGNAGVFDPGFSAGTANPVAGASSPMRMRITRDAGKQLGRIVTELPKGLLASPKSVGVCTEAQLASSTLAKAGRITQTAPSCPASSQIGTTTVGVGAGASPFFPLIPGTGVTGRVFLTGSHSKTDLPQPGKRQIAYGVGIEVPAVAGPFDLGTVLVRAAIYADPTTAELTVVSDKLPRILQGVPLNARDVRVDIDRVGFTRNPTSCREQSFGAEIQAQDGTAVQRSSRFQVGDCAALTFKPKLALRLTGKRQRKTNGHPGVRAVVTQKRGEAGIRKAAVRLPSSLALDPDNAQALCEYADGTKAEPACPKGSIVGRAKAVSPLLKRPVAGNVYFVKNVRRSRSGNLIRTLPMLVVALRGEIAVNLRGTASVKGGRLVNTFANVPDAPISRFNLNVKGGKNGILVVTRRQNGNSINLCASRQTAKVDMNGHNGKRQGSTIGVRTPCAKRKGTANRRARR
jgi:uncharacterized repeat protein (TIGR01451 family)